MHAVSLHKPRHREPYYAMAVDSPTRARVEFDPEWTGIGGAHVPDRHWLWDTPYCCATALVCPDHG